MKILMLTSSFPRYEGDFFGPWVLEYARELKRQGHHVYVVAPVSGKMGVLDFLSEERLEIIRFNYFYPRSWQTMVSPPGIIPNIKKNKLLFFHIPLMLFQFYRTARKIIKTQQIDVIHSQWVIPGGFIGGLLAQQFKLPHFITSQGAEFFLPINHPFSHFTKFTLKRCDYLLPVSHQMGERAVQFGMNPDKIKVVPNTVNPSIFKPDIPSDFRAQHHVPKDATIILTVRRLVHEKRVEDVLEAFAKINDSNAYLVIGGDGPERGKLEGLCASLNIKDKVIFLGYVANKDLPEIYAASDIYILSSAQEGLSLSLLESMSSALITITTAATGGNEVVEHGENGFVYRVGEVDKLAAILKAILAMSELEKVSIRQKARQTVLDRFSVQKMVGEWVKLYQSFVAEDSKSVK